MKESAAHDSDGPVSDTSTDEYAERLVALLGLWWKRAFNAQAPYRWNLKRLRLSRVLDVGCGIGRNLSALETSGVGVDHNKGCVTVARSLGLVAYEPVEFRGSEHATPGGSDASSSRTF